MSLFKHYELTTSMRSLEMPLGYDIDIFYKDNKYSFLSNITSKTFDTFEEAKLFLIHYINSKITELKNIVIELDKDE